VPTFICPAP